MRVDKSVIVLFRQMNLFLNRELLDEKLTSSDVLYLALLYEQDGRTQDEMAEAYTVDRAATTRSLQGLEKKGLVRREVDTFDRRIRRVYLTEKAMQYRTAIRRMADDLADALFEGMSEEEVKAFMEQVEAMGQRARHLNQRQERLPTCFPNNLHIVASIGATDHPKTKINGRCREFLTPAVFLALVKPPDSAQTRPPSSRRRTAQSPCHTGSFRPPPPRRPCG